MGRLVALLTLFSLTLFIFPFAAAADEVMGAVSLSAAGVGAGLPQVTSEQFTGKINSLAGAVYSDVVTIAPQITLFICVIGGILGIFWREARVSVIWSIGALVLILWAPQLIGLALYYTNQ